jgi:hypothetical protein
MYLSCVRMYFGKYIVTFGVDITYSGRKAMDGKNWHDLLWPINVLYTECTV